VVLVEAEAAGVMDRVVQTVETLVQPVVTEVVLEVPDLDVPAGMQRRRVEVLEQTVRGLVVSLIELLAAERDVVMLGLGRTLSEPVVVRQVIGVVHSHGAHRRLVPRRCTGLQRHRNVRDGLSRFSQNAAGPRAWTLCQRLASF
jgi:hypothetical protein